ncbi:MAG: ABC transporter ATP-binding protein [Actinobacteria bacterium]|nr:MAG: ABC transporter ATP-binding protein [Actinomycetota bacterium]
MSNLRLENTTVAYGGAKALDALSIHVEEGEFVALLGANGAGKTTTLRAISGIVKTTSGQMHFDRKEITKLPGHRRTALGIGHVPEGRQIFPDHTVEENLQLGGFTRRKSRTHVQESLSEMFALFPRLQERRKQVAGTLSGGEAQMLAVARALMSRPKILMLDEPSLGLAPQLVLETFRYLKKLHVEQGLTILLVEQQARLALQLASRAYILERGKVTIEGKARDLVDDPRVVEAYLGISH